MSRYASYGQLDAQFNTDGDVSFKGIDMKHDRPLLEPGMVAKSINKRLRTGVAVTRGGTTEPANFNPTFIGKFRGSVVYSNPNTGHEVLLVAEEGRSFIWQFEYGVAPVQIPITGGGTPITVGQTSSWFVQAFDKVIILRNGITPVVWDGLNYTVGFKPIVKSDPADTSTNLVPNVSYGIAFQNRILYEWNRDHILMSDVLDYTSYDPVLADIRVNAGQGDRIVCMHAYGKDAILVFMERSIHLIANFTTDPSLMTQTVVNDELGAVNREGAVQVGSDIIFLSRAGFYRVSQVLDTQVTSAPVPISDLISPIIESFGWDVIEFNNYVSAALLGDYCYFTAPIGHNYPINIFVYNTVTSMWESIDSWQNEVFFIQSLRVLDYNGVRRLFALNYRFAHIALLDEGIRDTTSVAGLDFPPAVQTTAPVNDILETRGYMERSQYGGPAGATTWKRFDRLTLMVRTRNPSILLSGLTDGYNEVKPINGVAITKSPQQSYLFSMQPYEGTLGPDFPYKEDYYQGETEWVAQDMSDILPGKIDLLPGVTSEMFGGPKTESMERRALRITGRWVSIRVDNRQGSCDILGCEVDMREKRRDTLTMA